LGKTIREGASKGLIETDRRPFGTHMELQKKIARLESRRQRRRGASAGRPRQRSERKERQGPRGQRGTTEKKIRNGNRLDCAAKNEEGEAVAVEPG